MIDKKHKNIPIYTVKGISRKGISHVIAAAEKQGIAIVTTAGKPTGAVMPMTMLGFMNYMELYKEILSMSIDEIADSPLAGELSLLLKHHHTLLEEWRKDKKAEANIFSPDKVYEKNGKVYIKFREEIENTGLEWNGDNYGKGVERLKQLKKGTTYIGYMSFLRHQKLNQPTSSLFSESKKSAKEGLKTIP